MKSNIFRQTGTRGNSRNIRLLLYSDTAVSRNLFEQSAVVLLKTFITDIPVSILYKSIAGRYRPVRVADGPITARYRFIKNAYWDTRIFHKFNI